MPVAGRTIAFTTTAPCCTVAVAGGGPTTLITTCVAPEGRGKRAAPRPLAPSAPTSVRVPKKKRTAQLRHRVASTRRISVSARARRSLGEGGFFNLRVLIGLFMVLAGVSLALLGSGASSPSGSSSAKAQQKYQPPIKVIDPTLLPPGFDCSKIRELGIDRQENFHAGLIMIA